jgi:hypothetical protein
VKPEADVPSAKAKDDIARISNLLVKSTVFKETLGLERFGIGIDFLVTSHAPIRRDISLAQLGKHKSTDHTLGITTDLPGIRYPL